MHVLVVSDTHMRRGMRRDLPAAVLAEAARADLVLHAGDVVDDLVLDLLGGKAPVHAVLGNNDHALAARLPERLELELAGVHVAMVHDSGRAEGREARLKRWFPDADLVVFGHSHIPWSRAGVDGQWLLNPGSPTERRRQPSGTYARVTLADGRVLDPEIVALCER